MSQKELHQGQFSDAGIVASNRELIVRTTYGRVKGSRLGNIRSFKGLPYASAPVGNLRFKAPEPTASWEGVRDTTSLGCQSVQSNPDYPAWQDPQPESEDCLYLNIWAPPASGSDPLPVMVWMHGGAYFSGSAGVPLYDGSKLAETANVVVVSVNHRLNVFGYLWLGDLIPELAAHPTPGQQDIVMALSWVRENIAAFGGDPSNVTAFGESGGGAKINSLLATPATDGLIHKAIIQSGSQLAVSTREQATAVASAVLSQLGDGPFDLMRLQMVETEKLRQAAQTVQDSFGILAFQPVVDGVFMPRQPWINGAPAGSHKIPLIVGTTSHEGLVFLTDPREEIPTDEDLARKFSQSGVASGISQEEFLRLLAKYRDVMGPTPRFNLLEAIVTDLWMWHSALIQAENQIKANGSVYFYEFAWKTPCFGGKWAPHAGELPFVFGNLNYATAWDGHDTDAQRASDDPTDERYKLAERIMQAWGSFAHTGNPTQHSQIWPQYDTKNRATMVFDERCKVENDRNASRRLYLNGLPPAW